jgi:hypothetical protein
VEMAPRQDQDVYLQTRLLGKEKERETSDL